MKVQTFTVLPDTPEKLKHLNELANDLYFAWNSEVLDLFNKLGAEEWKKADHNPVKMLYQVPQKILEKAAADTHYLSELEAVYERYSSYINGTTWYERQYGKSCDPKIAYFCCEFGIHECLPIYSGGLGVLSGDHIKSASDLGLPLVGVGLMYRHGYFHQHLDVEGRQQETFPENDIYSMPVVIEKDKNGIPLRGSLKYGNDRVFFNIWKARVGRSSIYLLDTNLEENSEYHREITNTLYDSNRDIRIKQEILLGIGGFKALKLLGFKIDAYHINEGHSAFLLLERVRHFMEKEGLTFREAKEMVWATTTFTTHTPVPAGNERFDNEVMERHFKDYCGELKISWKEFLGFGRVNPDNEYEEFCLTVLALKFSAFANGVSKLHGEVSRKMWKGLYPGIPEEEIPIGHITNGIHARSWLSPHILNLFLRYAKTIRSNELLDFDMWKMVDSIPDSDLWEIHQHKRKLLIKYVRKKVREQLMYRNAGILELKEVDSLLDPKALTIGFGRRFATYKRGDLFLRNEERIKSILCNPERPVQIIVTGKAHPADQYGKDIIKHIYDFSSKPEFKNKIVFLEDYDINIARHLLQGVDVWLNNPIRPKEASGTSGMKAAINGAINLSIKDGWWDEAYTPDVGWSIGNGEDFHNFEMSYKIESDLLYGELEREVVPLFYERNDEDIPENWVRIMKNSIRKLGVGFNSHRMLEEYFSKYYKPSIELKNRLVENNFSIAKELSSWHQEISEKWENIKIIKLCTKSQKSILKGEEFEIKALVNPGDIKAENIIVECYYGVINKKFEISRGKKITMEVEGQEKDGIIFKGKIPCSSGGQFGYTIRILPGHKDLAVHILPGMMKWYE